MSILIKGLEMPETCVQCKLRYFDPERNPGDGIGEGTHCCWLTDEEVWNTQRGELCPLEDVPPHGRLIDADALLKTLGIGDLPIRITYEINNAPTIIPASEEDER